VLLEILLGVRDQLLSVCVAHLDEAVFNLLAMDYLLHLVLCEVVLVLVRKLDLVHEMALEGLQGLIQD
jgi:hypothetical protein